MYLKFSTIINYNKINIKQRKIKNRRKVKFEQEKRRITFIMIRLLKKKALINYEKLRPKRKNII